MSVISLENDLTCVCFILQQVVVRLLNWTCPISQARLVTFCTTTHYRLINSHELHFILCSFLFYFYHSAKSTRSSRSTIRRSDDGPPTNHLTIIHIAANIITRPPSTTKIAAATQMPPGHRCPVQHPPPPHHHRSSLPATITTLVPSVRCPQQ